MTPDELYALGYALQTSAWGVHVFHLDQATDTEIKLTFHFTGPVSEAESARRGWEHAAAHFVQSRLSTDL